ncbi:MAG: putative lipid II flippase FtsW [Deltaproteobacteria bacterium]|jgi:cell division protein FtsW|nr:putative lipid II flippase FtsW [Deltaproteobacteria bacterium]
MLKRFFKYRPDTVLLCLIVILIGLGTVMLLSASFVKAEFEFRNPYFFFSAQLRNVAVGALAMLILSQIDYRIWLKYSRYILIFAAMLLILLLLPGMAKLVKGSGRWLSFLPFQPSEAAKLAVVIGLSQYYARIGDLKYRFGYGFVAPFLLMTLFGGLIALERDLGGPIVIVLVVVLMMVASGIRFKHFSFLLVMAFPLYYLITAFPHRMSRLSSWHNPWLDPLDSGYNIIHSFYAFASGGLFGSGLGLGQQKMYFLPEGHTDFIFSILGEELGFAGVVGTCALFFWLAARGFSIASSSKTVGGHHLGVGLTLTILVPALLNMCVALSIIPAKGLPLPFFSYGGSSMVVSCAALGILMNIAAQGACEEEAMTTVAAPDKDS